MEDIYRLVASYNRIRGANVIRVANAHVQPTGAVNRNGNQNEEVHFIDDSIRHSEQTHVRSRIIANDHVTDTTRQP